jgi:predicted dehydrogenase
MTESRVRIGLVGYGKGGRYYHAPLIEHAAGCQLVGVVTRSAQRRDHLAHDHPTVPAYGSLAELADAGVDAVVVTTPIDSHVALVQEAIARGLPVVCDKPFAQNAATARDTVLAAERAGVLLSVYQNRRWDADFLTVHKVIGSGVLGEVITFESRMELDPPATGVFSTTGGGVLRSLGSHVVDQALLLFGPGRSVYAQMHVLPEQDGFDDRFFAAVQHENGVSSHLTGSVALHGPPAARFRVIGAAATYAVESDDGQTDRLLAGGTPATDTAAWGTVPEGRWGRLFRGGVAQPVPAETGSWSTFYCQLALAVRGVAPVPVDPWDAVAALEVLDAARVSATSGKVVKLPHPGTSG